MSQPINLMVKLNKLRAVQNMYSKILPPLTKLAQWSFSNSYYRKIGLRPGDTVRRNYNTPGVMKEAVRRMPLQMQQERCYRIARAMLQSAAKTELPEEEWSEYHSGLDYLGPYIDTVLRDLNTIKYWDRYGEAPPTDTERTPEVMDSYRLQMQSIVDSMETPTR